jgi:hypothetical protein
VVVGGEVAPTDRVVAGAAVDEGPAAWGGGVDAAVASDQYWADAGFSAEAGEVLGEGGGGQGVEGDAGPGLAAFD